MLSSVCSLHVTLVLQSLSNLHICASGCNFSFSAVFLPKHSTIISLWEQLKYESPCFFLSLFNEWQTWAVYITVLMASLKMKPGTDFCKPCDFLSVQPWALQHQSPSGGWWHCGSLELGTALQAICSHPERMQNVSASQRKACHKICALAGLGKLKENCKVVEYN